MLEKDSVWDAIAFSMMIISARAFFHNRFQDCFGSAPPHEAFISWYLSRICSGSFETQNSDLPELDPMIRFIEKRSCKSISVSHVVRLFEEDVLSFMRDYRANIRSDWLFSYFKGSSVNVDYPQESLSYEIPNTSLSILSESYKGACFALDVSIMFMKYDSLFGFEMGEGRGWHLSVPDQFYSIIESEFDVDCELFGSPVNRRASRYFSLFSSDCVFGSLGDFFKSPVNLSSFLSLVGSPARLTVEANPPFQPLLMMRFARRLTQLLSDADGARYDFFCVCIVPDWPKCEPIEFLRQSPFLIHSISLEKGEHKYKPGWADVRVYEADPRYWKNTETLILLLGSMSTRARYNVDEDLERRIKQSWKPNN